MEGSNGWLVMPGLGNQGTNNKSALRWWHVRWKRPLKVLGILFAGFFALFGIMVLLGFQFGPWRLAHAFSNIDPRVNDIPLPLKDVSLASLDGPLVQREGYSFRAPWKAPVSVILPGDSYPATFPNGARVLVMAPSGFDEMKLLREEADAHHGLDPNILRSHYGLMSAAMATTSDRVKWWKLPNQNVQDLALLEFKIGAFHDPGPLYEVHFGQMRGFQVGDPAASPFKVEVTVFDPSDRQYRIDLFPDDGKGQAFSQPQINAMIASMRPVAAR